MPKRYFHKICESFDWCFAKYYFDSMILFNNAILFLVALSLSFRFISYNTLLNNHWVEWVVDQNSKTWFPLLESTSLDVIQLFLQSRFELKVYRQNELKFLDQIVKMLDIRLQVGTFYCDLYIVWIQLK